MYNDRIKKLQHRVKEEKLDALIVSNRINIQYLTGFNGTYGFLIVEPDKNVLYTDARYFERCKRDINDVSIRLIKSEWYKDLKIKKLGFEANTVDYVTYWDLRKKFNKINLIPVKYMVEKIRMIKDSWEIKNTYKAVDITEDLLRDIKRLICAGKTAHEVFRYIDIELRKKPFTEPAFEPILSFGEDTCMPHAGTSSRRLSRNKIAMIDIGAKYNGYSSDLTRTFWIGRITRKFEEIYNIVLTAQLYAVEKIRPGVRLSDIDAAARDYITKKGYGKYFNHALGHGMGLEIHEIPRVGKNSKYRAEMGMIFSVEPGIYIKGWGGVRIEDMALVTEDGCKIMTTAPKDLKDIVITDFAAGRSFL